MTGDTQHVTCDTGHMNVFLILPSLSVTDVSVCFGNKSYYPQRSRDSVSPVGGIIRIATVDRIVALLALAATLYSLSRAGLTTRNCGGKTVKTVTTGCPGLGRSCPWRCRYTV